MSKKEKKQVHYFRIKSNIALFVLISTVAGVIPNQSHCYDESHPLLFLGLRSSYSWNGDLPPAHCDLRAKCMVSISQFCPENPDRNKLEGVKLRDSWKIIELRDWNNFFCEENIRRKTLCLSFTVVKRCKQGWFLWRFMLKFWTLKITSQVFIFLSILPFCLK